MMYFKKEHPFKTSNPLAVFSKSFIEELNLWNVFHFYFSANTEYKSYETDILYHQSRAEDNAGWSQF